MGRRCAFPFLFLFSKYYKLPEKAEPLKELSAEDIYAVCSPAVFYIEIYDLNGKKIGSGSGFFIDDKGTAVTNYHVIKDAYSAKASGVLLNSDFISEDDYKFSFDDYVGIRGVESSHVSLAMSLHHSLLAFTNQIFAKAMLQHGIYTVADLGYTNFEA